MVEINQLRLCAANRTICPILDGDAVNQQPVKRPVPHIERRAFKTDDFAERIVDRFGGQGWTRLQALRVGGSARMTCP